MLSTARTRTVWFIVAVVGGGVSCSSSVPCVTMNGPGALVTNAALLRLDVYGAGIPCDGPRVAPGAGAPTDTATFRPGDPIEIELAPGPHTFVLTSFSDAGG